jgi:hypothetical protein
MSNYIFFANNNEPDRPIFRVFGIERLLQIFSNRELILVRPKKWDDPFENFILNSRATLETGEHITLTFENSLYGQCWTQHKENDGMWRIYSPQKNGVKVRTTARKLRESLADVVESPELTAFIGKVQYKRNKDLTAMVSDRVRMQRKIFGATGRGHAESLLFKRDAFSHEKEIRLIYTGAPSEGETDLFSFAVDPHALFEEVVFDPRMDTALCEIYEKHLKSIGFPGKIKRSQLYEVPNITVRA